MQGSFFHMIYLLLLFASDDIKYFDLKSKQTQMFFIFSLLQKIISWSNQISIQLTLVLANPEGTEQFSSL